MEKNEIVESEIQNYISNTILRLRKPVETNTSLIGSGLIDSLGLLQIVGFIEKKYGVNLARTGNPEDFQSISSLASAVCQEVSSLST